MIMKFDLMCLVPEGNIAIDGRFVSYVLVPKGGFHIDFK